MAIIKTKRNYVYALEPLDDDCMVETLIGPGGTPSSYRRLIAQPIDRYREAVSFAVGIADQFEHPIHIVPITAGEFIEKVRNEERPSRP